MLQTQRSAGNDKAISAILAHLEELRSKRPSELQAAGKSAKTSETIRKIIAAAHEIFIQDGHAGLTLRHVADSAGIAVGNLTYHFPSKRVLLDAMLCEALADYVDEHIRIFKTGSDSPMEILMDVVEFHVHNGRQAHRFFYQMWGYAACDEEAKMTIRNFFRMIGRFIYYLVRAANPKLNDAQIRCATLQIASLEEGYKLFIGLGPDDNPAINRAEEDIRLLTEKIVMTS